VVGMRSGRQETRPRRTASTSMRANASKASRPSSYADDASAYAPCLNELLPLNFISSAVEKHIARRARASSGARPSALAISAASVAWTCSSCVREGAAPFCSLPCGFSRPAQGEASTHCRSVASAICPPESAEPWLRVGGWG
jgi:hypothetical protein